MEAEARHWGPSLYVVSGGANRPPPYLYTFITLHRFTNMSALLFTAAMVVFMMGLMSEQINGAELSRRGSVRRVPVGLL